MHKTFQPLIPVHDANASTSSQLHQAKPLSPGHQRLAHAPVAKARTHVPTAHALIPALGTSPDREILRRLECEIYQSGSMPHPQAQPGTAI
jgi:hypothetical protein